MPSILSAPNDEVLRRLAAANADVRKVVFNERDAPRLDPSGLVLDLVLAGDVAAPHGADIAGLVRGDIEDRKSVV